MTTRHVFFVQINYGFGEGSRQFTLLFETAHDTVESLTAALVRDGVVYGSKVTYRVVGDRAIIVAREEISIGAAGLVTISNPRREFYEFPT